MQDELMESMKSYYHLQRIPSLSVRDKEMVVLPRGLVEDSGDQTFPQHISSQASPLCGTAEEAHWPFLSENALGR